MRQIAWKRATLVVMCVAVAGLARAADDPARVPDFSGFWAHGVTQIVYQPIPGAAAGPVIDVLNIACTPNCPPRPAGQHFIGDHTNPILKPNAAAAVKANGDLWRSGEIVNAATELCAPSGVPHITTVFGPVQFLQTPDQITILYQRDHQVRRVWMNRPHTANLKPSWYGESIGRYEGDILVIDTIGLNDRSTIDRFGAPQTETTHVVERYRISADGRSLVAHITVDDPNVFTMPWSGTITFARNANLPVLAEEICAENNRVAETTDGVLPLPTASDAEYRQWRDMAFP